MYIETQNRLARVAAASCSKWEDSGVSEERLLLEPPHIRTYLHRRSRHALVYRVDFIGSRGHLLVSAEGDTWMQAERRALKEL